MRTLYSFVFIILFVKICNSQVNSFQLSYGESGNDVINSVASLGERGYLLFGTTNNFLSNRTDLILIRINAEGVILWINRYGGAGDETAEHVESTADNGYILSASTTSFGAGNSDLLLIKTDANGIVTWSRTFGGSANDFSACIKEVPEGGYIVAGRTQSFGQGGDDGYLIRINNQGNLIWSNSYGTINNERFYYVNNTADSGFIITGIENTSNFLRYDQLVLKTDSRGNITFINSYGDNGGVANDASDCIRQTNDGGYAFSGHYQSFGAGGLDLALTKINSTGDLEWARVYGNNGNERAWDFQITENNDYLLSGYTSSYGNGNNDAVAILVNNDGTIEWSRTYGGRSNEEFNECIINNDSILLVGFTESIGSGSQDMYVVKTDFNGNLSDGCTNMGTDLIQNSTVTPSVRRINHIRRNLDQATSTFNPNIQRVTLELNLIRSTNPCLTTTPVTLVNFSFCKEEQSVSLCWQTSNEINTNSFVIEQSLNGILFDSIGYVRASNEREKNNIYKYYLPYNDNDTYYRLKISDFDGYYEYTNIIYHHHEKEDLFAFPTYFSSSFTIKTPNTPFQKTDVEIIDINGVQRHKSTYYNIENIIIDTFSWPQGLLFLRITNSDGNYYVTKIIKE